MTDKPPPIPAFASEADERAFWESHDSTDYIDWSLAEQARFPNLKPRRRPFPRGCRSACWNRSASRRTSATCLTSL